MTQIEFENQVREMRSQMKQELNHISQMQNDTKEEIAALNHQINNLQDQVTRLKMQKQALHSRRLKIEKNGLKRLMPLIVSGGISLKPQTAPSATTLWLRFWPVAAGVLTTYTMMTLIWLKIIRRASLQNTFRTFMAYQQTTPATTRFHLKSNDDAATG